MGGSLDLSDTGFNPRTPGGVRQSSPRNQIAYSSFQSTHPGRGATTLQFIVWTCLFSFNPRTPGGVRRFLESASLNFCVSIHAPRAGCDPITNLPPVVPHVSIHAPRAGCDISTNVKTDNFSKFQSTHPGRGATLLRLFVMLMLLFQSTHPGRGATDETDCFDMFTLEVSIHAPRAGCDGQNGMSL